MQTVYSREEDVTSHAVFPEVNMDATHVCDSFWSCNLSW